MILNIETILYVILPLQFMRIKHRRFDPFAESTVDGIIAGTVTIKVLHKLCTGL